VIDDLWVVEVRLVAGERVDFSLAFGRLLMVAFGLVQPAKTPAAVMHAGKARQHVMGGRITVRLANKDQIAVRRGFF
jgi:hypothetical protein